MNIDVVFLGNTLKNLKFEIIQEVRLYPVSKIAKGNRLRHK